MPEPISYLIAKFKVVESKTKISQMIRLSLFELVNAWGKSGIEAGMVREIRQVLMKILMEADEYKSLLDILGEPTGTSLYTLFGIENAQEAVNTILNHWIDNIRVTSSFVSMDSLTSYKKIWGTITVSAIQADFKDVIDLGENISWFMSEGKHAGPVHWLEWLLLRGQEVVVGGFDALYVENRTPKFSRTHQAIMVRDDFGFSVPSQYAGTIRDNWPVRAVAKAMLGGANSLIGQAIIKGVGNLLG